MMMPCVRPAFERSIQGQTAWMPAGSTLDWTLDLSAVMAAESDQMITATWELATGLTPGAQTDTATSTTLFISAPADASKIPYLCTITYTTTGGRVVIKQFLMYVRSPLSFH